MEALGLQSLHVQRIRTLYGAESCRKICKRRKLARHRTFSVSEAEEERLQSTLSALDIFLRPDGASEPAGEDSRSSTAALPEPTPKAAEALSETTADDPAPVDWRGMDKKALVQWALAKARSSIRDAVKPTSIIEEDDYLPRAQARYAYLIMLANILVYGVGLSRLVTEGPEGPMNYFLSLAEVNEAVEAGEYFSYALLTIAPEAEAVLGSFAFLTTYLLGGAAGTALCFLLTDTITVGASSGIFGLIGAMGAFLYKNHKVPKSSDGLLAAVGLLAFNLFLGGDHTTTVDNVGHFGGLVCGIYLGVLLSPAVIERRPLEGSTPGSTTPDNTTEESAGGGKYSAAEASLPASEMPRGEALRPGSQSRKSRPRDVKVVQPNRLQSLVVLACVTVTLASSVAATVIHRTGELPLPKWL